MTRFTETVMHMECSKAELLVCQKEFVGDKLFEMSQYSKWVARPRSDWAAKKKTGVRGRNTETFCQR
jgi:hypothetical protein